MPECRLITVLCERFDYSGAYNIAKALSIHESKLGALLRLCVYSVNFDFLTAQTILNANKELFSEEAYEFLWANHEDLIDGYADALFSEHLWSMRFQLMQEEYIDFLGRLYRFNEAFFKYVFVLHHKRKLPMFDDIYSEGRILRILRKQYNIYNRNIIFAILSFLEQHASKEPGIQAGIDLLSSTQMKGLVDLRNESLVGHGYHAVSRELITRHFAPPQELMEKLQTLLEGIGLEIETRKYTMINELIAEEVEKESRCSL